MTLLLPLAPLVAAIVILLPFAGLHEWRHQR